MAVASIDGVELEYLDEGSGSPPFVFIHGWACDLQSWAPQFQNLKSDFRCVAVNLRGRGRSSATPPFHTTQAADDIAALLQRLGVEPAIVAGHSLGGMVALLLNDRHGEHVRGIVLGDSPATVESASRWASLATRIREAGSMDVARDMVEGFFTAGTPEPVRDYARRTILGCDPEVAAGMLDEASVFVSGLDSLLKEADKKPFMAIWASNPLGSPEMLRAATVFVRQEPVPGAGHFFQLEKPDLTNALLRAFVDDVVRDPRVSSPA
ncbi:MAG: alpha/beta hydrolase [Dehalococcoidia bacterium]